MTKQCKACGEIKPLTDFHHRPDTRDKRLSKCKVCHTAYAIAFRKKHPHRRAAYDAKYRDKNYDRLREIARQWAENNRHKTRAQGAKTRAMLLNATPKWVLDNPEMLRAIEDVFALARKLELSTGQKWHVDHIEPLKGEDRSGLHVPWNLQPMLAEDNLRKSNKTNIVFVPRGHGMSMVQSIFWAREVFGS